MAKISFSEKFVLKENIYFLQESKNTLFFFEPEGEGFYIYDEENKGRFKWVIEDGFLTINGYNINESWEIKQANKEKEILIIRVHENDKHYDDVLSWAFEEKDYDEIKKENKKYSFINVFKKLTLKNQIIISATFFFIALFFFILMSNLFLLKEMHFLLKILFLSIIIILVKDKVLHFLIDFINKKEK